jgi:hypothetical protein
MKTYIQKLMVTAGLGLALLSTSIPAWAGFTETEEVQVYTNTGVALGTMTGARYSADNTQYIGCSLERGTIPPREIYCEAQDRYNKRVACRSNEARFIGAVKAMTDSSYIFFSVVPGTGLCASVSVRNNSAYLK